MPAMGQTIATNKKAFRDFNLFDKWECGIALKGGEVKSIRAGNLSFNDSFARLDKDEVFLYNLHIDAYPQASYLNLDPDRPRKLLLNKNEIQKLKGSVEQKGLLLVPTKMYFNNRGFVKVELSLGKGKKLYDKREDIKKRDVGRELARAVRNRRK
jgi:SsrA-binding protein